VVQGEAYGELLAANGYETDGLVHAVAVLPSGRARADGLADVLAARALELSAMAPWPASRAHSPSDPRVGLATRRVETDAYVLEVFPHDAAAAAAHIGWAAGYWKGERAPVATSFAGKCRACPLNAAGLCAVAAAAPDGRYRAQVVIGRQGGVLHLLAPAR
jgi:hypothetical protein